MTNLSLTVRYRPARIGWCVRDGNWEDLRSALRLTQIFWGGAFNPVIPVGASASHLIKKFRVDVLFPVNKSAEGVAFAGSYDSLRWPLFETELIGKFGDAPNFLDVSHPLKTIRDQMLLHDGPALGQEAPPQGFESSQYTIVKWADNDPLADVLLATFGAYPGSDQTGRDYEGFLLTNLRPFLYRANTGSPLPAELMDHSSVCDITASELQWDRIPADRTMGFYVGKTDNFQDIVNYWNLRAAEIDVLFLDPSHTERMQPLRSAYSEAIIRRHVKARQHPYALLKQNESRIPVWSRSQEAVAQLGFTQKDVSYYTHVEGMDVVGPNISPPLHYLSRKGVLGSVVDRYGSQMLSFQLPEKPFVPEDLSEELFVVSVRTPYEDTSEWSTFWTPYEPRLNFWLGQKTLLGGRSARVELEGIGVLTRTTSDSINLWALKKVDLAKKLFELAGIDACVSHPGRIAMRLTSQLGGIQGCRVLKIAGVRKLIRKYGPLQEFDRTDAIRLIGNLDPKTGIPRFSEYEDLFIEDRDWSAKLKPEDAFGYLLDRGVFRAGLTFTCASCELPFWVSLDDVSTVTTCEVCGAKFNVLRQLKTRDWQYRRSGLFGRDNNQEGSIPVALTLQQLHAQFHSLYGSSIFLPNMTLQPVTSSIVPCETDIFIAAQEGSEMVLAVGECKDVGGSITADDVEKMTAVAEALSNCGFHCYIIFAKTGSFTTADVENCKLANKNGRTRAIMLSDRELEPYHVYERTSLEFEISRGGHSLHDMAITTHEVFFSPRPKKKSSNMVT
jgi:hypothetical protein